MLDSDGLLNDLLKKMNEIKLQFIKEQNYYMAGHLKDMEKKLRRLMASKVKEKFLNDCLKIMTPNDNNSSKEM